MTQNSDTESDSDSEQHTFSSPAPLSTPSPITERQNVEKNYNQILLAIREIELEDQMDLKRLCKNLGFISSFLAYLLDDLVAHPQPRINDNQLFVIALLARESFLARIFSLRATIYQIAETEALDILYCTLMQFLSASVLIGTGGFPLLSQSLPSSLRQIRERDLYVAMRQLPRDWEMLPRVLSSRAFSPATQRCALQILVVIYVIGPQIGNNTPSRWENGSLLDHLHTCIEDALNYQSMFLSTASSEDGKVVASLFLCLFSTVHYAASQLSVINSFPLRPRSFGFLLELVTSVTGYPYHETCIPVKELSPAQTLLLWWSNFTPWAWSIWEDQRSADSEVIVFLTSTWLLHMDSPLRRIDDPTHLEGVLQQNPHASGIIISELFQSLNRVICGSVLRDNWEQHRPFILTVLVKCTASLIDLLLPGTFGRGNPTRSILAKSCECMLGLFCCADNSREVLHGKKLILEALSLVDTQVLVESIQAISSNKAVQFFSRLDQDIGNCKRLLEGLQRQSCGEELGQISLTVNFILLVWQSNPAIINVFAGKALVERGLYFALETGRLSIPFQSSIVLAAALYDDLAGKELQSVEELIFKIAAGSQDLVSASALAFYTIKNRNIKNTAVLFSTFDYLRTTLSAILSGSHFFEKQPLALLVSPVVCHALYKLTTYSSSLERFIAASPWTLSLRSALELFLGESTSTGPEEYSPALRAQLEVSGNALLNKITAAEHSVCPDENQDPSIQLVYLQGHTEYGNMVAKCR